MNLCERYRDRATADAQEIVSLIDELAPCWGIPTARLEKLVYACSGHMSSEEVRSCLLEINLELEALETLGMPASRYWATVECDDEEAPLALIADDLLSTQKLVTLLVMGGALGVALREILERERSMAQVRGSLTTPRYDSWRV